MNKYNILIKSFFSVYKMNFYFLCYIYIAKIVFKFKKNAIAQITIAFFYHLDSFENLY